MPIDWRSTARAAMVIFAFVALFVILVVVAYARPGQQWDNAPEQIREWFQSVMQPENPLQSCCGPADAFDVEMAGNGPNGSFIVKIISGPLGTEDLIGRTVIVPHAKLQTKYGNPTGRFILFMGTGERIYCLIPQEGT